MKVKHVFFFATALSCFNVHAGKVRIINENKEAITIHLIPEGADTENLYYETTIGAEAWKEYYLTSANIEDKNFFTLNGEIIVGGSSCIHLDIDKDYKITFLNEGNGTTCIARKM